MSSSTALDAFHREPPPLEPASSPACGGKRSRTQSIGPSLGSLADRVATVLQRRAAGAPTGGDHAEALVAAAASSSGTPLGADVRQRFEASLGADLSAVRVHTGEDSAAAARAVGAHAYATGQDIHFAQGMYRPDDPFGLHLLAHEVAHTVQQSGGAQRRQHKLEVSTPHDAAEHEADRAADAMVRGEAATVSGGSGTGGVALSRSAADEIDEAADLAPKYHDPTIDAMEVEAGHLSLSGEFANAHAAISGINSENKFIHKLIGIGVGDFSSTHTAANTKAVCMLESYTENLDIQDTAMHQFKTEYDKSCKDFDRLKNAVLKFKEKYPSAGEKSGESTDPEEKFKLSPSELDVKTRAKMTDAQGKKLEDSHGDENKSGKRDKAQTAIGDVNKSMKAASSAQGALQGKQMDLQSMAAKLASKSGRVADGSDNANMKKVNTEIAAFKSTVGSVLKAVKLVITQNPISFADEFYSEEDKKLHEELAPALPKGLPGKGAAAAKQVADVFSIDMVDTVAKAMFEQATNVATAMDADDMTKKEFAHEKTQLIDFKAKKLEMTEAIKAYKDAMAEFDQKKATMRAKIREMGKEADNRTGNTGAYEAAAVLYAECSNYVAQAKLTHEMGERETARGNETKAARSEVTDYQRSDAEKGYGAGIADPSGVVWYSASKKKDGSYEPKINHVGKDKLKLNTYTAQHGFTTSHEGSKEKVMADLKTKYNMVQDYRTYLGGLIKIF